MKLIAEGLIHNELGMKLDEELDKVIATYVDSL